MTARTTIVVQARVPAAEASRLDEDAAALGLGSRSEAVREALRLLHRRARDAALARSYDQFYGSEPAPTSDTVRVGDVLAAETIAARERR